MWGFNRLGDQNAAKMQVLGEILTITHSPLQACLRPLMWHAFELWSV